MRRAGLAAGGEGLRQQVVEGLAFGQAFAELRRQRGQFVIAEGVHLLFELVDLVEQQAGDDGGRIAGLAAGNVAELADVALVGGAEQPQQEATDVVGQAGEAVAQLLPEGRFHGGIGSAHEIPVLAADLSRKSVKRVAPVYQSKEEGHGGSRQTAVAAFWRTRGWAVPAFWRTRLRVAPLLTGTFAAANLAAAPRPTGQTSPSPEQ